MSERLKIVLRNPKAVQVFRIVDSPYKRLLFVVNRDKHRAGELAARLSGLARSAGFDTDIASSHPLGEDAFRGFDLCCVIGGDGTILGCVNGAAKYNVPVFGINLGKLGFMATFTDAIGDGDFLDAIRGGSESDERSLLAADFGSGEHLALNEFVIKSANVAGIASLRVSADGEFVSDFVGDGLIFSTPTGSTAYNLSANGPLLHPRARAYVLTSICPHTLSNRSIVFADSSSVEVTGSGALLIADGSPVGTWDPQRPLKIYTSDKKIKFLRPHARSHFSVLRTKLGWAAVPARSGNGGAC